MTAVVALMLSGVASCDSDDSDDCEDRVEKLEATCPGYLATICDSMTGRCLSACDARATCDELLMEEWPVSLRRCYARCWDRFECAEGDMDIDGIWECDGEQDCRDGSDEHADCEYFECADGALTLDDARCDGYADCGDGSDETGCQ